MAENRKFSTTLNFGKQSVEESMGYVENSVYVLI
jgi:hypothetical protein